MINLRIALLRAWVFLVWNIRQIIDCIRGKRSVFIPINDLRVLYNNGGLLVVDKSQELLINSDNSWFDCVTLQMQFANFRLKHMFWFVHRLDAPTSGLICIAYSKQMASLVGKAFQDRTTKKYYLAVVWGHVRDSSVFDETRIPSSNYLPLSVDPSYYSSIVSKIDDSVYLVRFAIGDYLFEWPSGRKQRIMAPSCIPTCSHPRLAETKITVLKHGYLEGSSATLLLLQPHSGRRHQLRLHCALGLRGHPIAGDLIYGRLFGNGEAMEKKDYALPRLMLHAYSLHIQLVPKPPYVKGMKKQERVNRSHPEPVELKFKSDRDLLRGCHWIDHEVFRQIETLDGSSVTTEECLSR